MGCPGEGRLEHEKWRHLSLEKCRCLFCLAWFSDHFRGVHPDRPSVFRGTSTGWVPKFNILCVIKSHQPLDSIKVIRDTYHIPLPHPLGNSLRQEQKETE